jgi:hypothetical protein
MANFRWSLDVPPTSKRPLGAVTGFQPFISIGKMTVSVEAKMKISKVDKTIEARIQQLLKKLEGVSKESLRNLPFQEQVELIKATIELDRLMGLCNRVTPIDVN